MSEAVSASRTKITGVCPPARAYALTRLVTEAPAPTWLAIVEEARELDTFAEDLALFHHAAGTRAALDVLVFPESQADSRDMREAFNAASDRLAVLSKLRGRKHATSARDPLLVLTTPGALLQPVPPPEDFSEREITLHKGEERSFQGLLELLKQFDYDSEAVCEAPGQYAVRGGIVDLYPITAHQPYRLDFFGDTLEDIRTLDPVSQRSGESVERITLTAAPHIHAARAQASLLDYLGAATHVALVEPKALEEAFDLLGGAAAETGRASSPHEPSTAADKGTERDSFGELALPPLLAAVSHRAARLFGVSDLDLASALFDDVPDEQTSRHGTPNRCVTIARFPRTISSRMNASKPRTSLDENSLSASSRGSRRATRWTSSFPRKARNNARASCSMKIPS
jgi:transcription-repair coupling factor (superfamily II helicase)